MLTGTLCAADLSLPITGNLVGSVVDGRGVPQMGATIQLLNKYHQTISQASSDVAGHFAFASLPEDLYSLRASLPSFLPVSRDKVTVKAGLDSVLQIHLATLFSSMEISYILPSSAMTDDWKWVLRSSAATRPINRLLGGDPVTTRTPMFSETHAFLSVSGGDGGPLDPESSLSEIGTGFALSTLLYGKNRLQVSGTLGDENTLGPPTVSLSAVYSRNDGSNLGRPPEVTFTAAQVAGIGSPFSPAPQGLSTNAGSITSVPLHAMSLSLYEVLDVVDRVHLEYGVTGESVDFLQHTSRISPFARMTVDTGKAGQWIASYSDGGRPDQLLRHGADNNNRTDSAFADEDLASAVSSLQKLPQISSRAGRLVLQRTQNLELGYKRVAGSQTYAISGFAEDVTDGRLSVVGTPSASMIPDLLSDSLSRTSTWDMGNYRRSGFLASVDQQVGNGVQVGLAYGRMGSFAGDASQSITTMVSRGLLREANANFAAANIKAIVPRVGTKITADYGWVDGGRVMPRHLFTTQQAYAAPGLNIYLRQPLPSFPGMPGRFELTADLRNLLAQGYLPVNTGGGHQLLIVQSPQSVRGGLNFTF